MVLSLKELKCISGRIFRETKNIKRTSNVIFIVPARGAEKIIRSRVNYRGGKGTRRREVNKIKSVYNPFLCSAQRDETMKQINVKTKYP